MSRYSNGTTDDAGELPIPSRSRQHELDPESYVTDVLRTATSEEYPCRKKSRRRSLARLLSA